MSLLLYAVGVFPCFPHVLAVLFCFTSSTSFDLVSQENAFLLLVVFQECSYSGRLGGNPSAEGNKAGETGGKTRAPWLFLGLRRRGDRVHRVLVGRGRRLML